MNDFFTFKRHSSQGSSSNSKPSTGQLKKLVKGMASYFYKNDRSTEGPAPFDPEEAIAAKRKWLEGRKVQKRLEWPERFFEHFLIVGLPPDVEITHIAEQLVAEERKQREHDGGAQDGKVDHEHNHPPSPSYEPQVLYRYPEDKSVPLTDKEIKGLCFPHNVAPAKLKRTPSLSSLNEVIYGKQLVRDDQCFVFFLKVDGTFPMYGLCCYINEVLHRPPYLARHHYPNFKAPFRQCLIAAPRCYCLLSHYPFFELHFQVLQVLLGLERLQRCISFNSETAQPDRARLGLPAKSSERANRGRRYCIDCAANIDEIYPMQQAAAEYDRKNSGKSHAGPVPENHAPAALSLGPRHLAASEARAIEASTLPAHGSEKAEDACELCGKPVPPPAMAPLNASIPVNIMRGAGAAPLPSSVPSVHIADSVVDVHAAAPVKVSDAQAHDFDGGAAAAAGFDAAAAVSERERMSWRQMLDAVKAVGKTSLTLMEGDGFHGDDAHAGALDHEGHDAMDGEQTSLMQRMLDMWLLQGGGSGTGGGASSPPRGGVGKPPKGDKGKPPRASWNNIGTAYQRAMLRRCETSISEGGIANTVPLLQTGDAPANQRTATALSAANGSGQGVAANPFGQFGDRDARGGIEGAVAGGCGAGSNGVVVQMPEASRPMPTHMGLDGSFSIHPTLNAPFVASAAQANPNGHQPASTQESQLLIDDVFEPSPTALEAAPSDVLTAPPSAAHFTSSALAKQLGSASGVASEPGPGPPPLDVPQERASVQGQLPELQGSISPVLDTESGAGSGAGASLPLPTLQHLGSHHQHHPSDAWSFHTANDDDELDRPDDEAGAGPSTRDGGPGHGRPHPRWRHANGNGEGGGATGNPTARSPFALLDGAAGAEEGAGANGQAGPKDSLEGETGTAAATGEMTALAAEQDSQATPQGGGLEGQVYRSVSGESLTGFESESDISEETARRRHLQSITRHQFVLEDTLRTSMEMEARCMRTSGGVLSSQLASMMQCTSESVLEAYYGSRVVVPGDTFVMDAGDLYRMTYRRPCPNNAFRPAGPTYELLSYAEVELAESLQLWTVAALCRCLSLDNILTLLLAALLERHIVVFCPNIGMLSAIVLSVVPLLRPFAWHCPMIPVTTSEMLDMLDAPVPFVMGVQYKTQDVAARCSSHVRVNVYKDQVKNGGGSMPALPGARRLAASLSPAHAALQRYRDTAALRPIYMLSAEEQLAAGAFLSAVHSFLSNLCGDLRLYTIKDVGKQDLRAGELLVDSMIESQPNADRPFFREFLKRTMMFTVYSDTVISALCEGS